MEIWSHYGLFLLQALTVLVVILVIVAALGRNTQGDEAKGRLVITNLSARFDAQRDQLSEAVQRASKQPKGLWARLKTRCTRRKTAEPISASRDGVVYVLDFKGDIQASRAEALKQEITTILALESKPAEVVIRLESPGGLVHRYGFAASELARLEAAEIPTTVCVDTVAASGGYMMAVCARQIVASPFAILGSIGVVAQVPNIHRFLKRHEIDVELHTAGSHKRTLTVLGENTPEGRRKFRDDLAHTHQLFKSWIQDKRPQLDVESVADGSIFYGQDALAKGLVDRISPSDEILQELSSRHTVLHLAWVQRKSFAKRLTGDVLSEVSARAESWIMKRSEDFTRL